MKKSLFFTIFMAILLASCDDELPSLHPVVQEENAITLEDIEGRWADITGEHILGDRSLTWTIDIQTDDPTENVDSLKAVLNDEMEALQSEEPELKFSLVRAANLTWYKDTSVTDSNVEDPSHFDFNISLKRVPRNFKPSFVRDDNQVDGMKLNSLFEEELLNFYYLSVEGEEQPVAKVMITKIEDASYLDFEPIKGDDFDERNFFNQNFITGHTFAKIEKVESGQMIVRPFDADYLTKLITERRVRLKHEMINVLHEKQIIITASTHELRAFIRKFGDRKELYKEGVVFGKYDAIQ